MSAELNLRRHLPTFAVTSVVAEFRRGLLKLLANLRPLRPILHTAFGLL